jgi:hypothetical protein
VDNNFTFLPYLLTPWILLKVEKFLASIVQDVISMVVTLLEEEKIFKKINTLKKYGMASLEAITNLVINGKVICQLIKKD